MSETAVDLEELDERYFDCRNDLRHAWQSMASTKDIPDAEPGFYWKQARCARCKTKRLFLKSERTGATIKRRYEHPEGYRLNVRVSSGEIELEYRRRMAQADNRKAQISAATTSTTRRKKAS